ncbi:MULTISPECIES: PTS system mannose/fructose/sorbose family transporter subunit IID [Bacillota]|jgi:mannose/fructose/N-acetylgalactosamine-specific phosphotransferase system component IID|uniref:PTS system mannose/fructose/sorbose family transporter subunit IID n=2 Tax=Amedibacillus TaxID=2749846 RepID=A0A7G9GNV7_9FIRM|nr:MULTISPECIES: PTS system mannose/fructose/sorbose family transporter subunit IID [Bacillota]QNM12489.1 PTS system mannose/fructose/sorbose family transporter subunit IID [[Eubacterium] hominis]MCH4284203.1 PTS system mannose/fructose/sorbose family transporter subunit IID [Amedibacillus hominis]RGB57544.1 PTS system mannose/fructose/sorbose family transporter subunit IID [Absiella sp. AM22-9]RGB62349.1 PTS system mannose/fructose/sorbose family transporter subunit IID [Absiella sp. AM10-20]
MAENQEIMEEKRIKLRKSDLMKSFAIWELTSEMCLSYERLMSLGFCHAMLPILKRLYPDKDDLADAMTRHMAFFNTENQFGALIPGMIASVEEERANGTDYSDEVINGLKIGLMGPLAGVGDTITQGLVKTILLAICVEMGLKGNVWGSIIFFVLYTAYILGVGYTMFFSGYKLGKNAFSKISDTSIIRKLTDCMGVLGMTVAGCMIANYVSIQTVATFTSGDTVIEIQALLDEIMPGILSVGTVFILYALIRKNVSVIKIMGVLVVIGILGAFVGIF